MNTRPFHPLLLGLTLLCVVGCPQPTPDAGTAQFGRFEGDIVAQWNADGRMMTLREDFAYIDPTNRRWVAPAGSVVNGASIPTAFWSVIGGPFEGQYRNASVIHDVGCETMAEPWEDVHKVFYDACRCGGVDEFNAKMLYYAVYHFGPRWEIVTDTVVSNVAAANASVGVGAPAGANAPLGASAAIAAATNDSRTAPAAATTALRVARFDPPPPTAEEVAQVAQLIAQENPSADTIQTLDRKEMRRRCRQRSQADGTGNQLQSAGDGVDRMTPRASDDTPINPLRFGSSQPRDLRGRSQRPQMAFAAGSSALPQQTNDTAAESMGRAHFIAAGRPRVVSAEEEAWLIDIARNFIATQAGEDRPAEYAVDLSEGAYRVVVYYLHEGEQRGWERDGGCNTMFVSRQGQVLESFSGER